MSESWDARVALVWSEAPRSSASQVLQRIDALVTQRPPTDARAVFESASVRDYTDRESEAEILYRRALDLGLEEPYRSRAVIQLASTLRNLGQPDQAITLLQEGFATTPDHPLGDAARAFLALCLADSGDTLSATAVALDALAQHLPEYSRSVRAYAGDLLERAAPPLPPAPAKPSQDQ
jgi:tetratricopeptide (TPR) repeat protein